MKLYLGIWVRVCVLCIACFSVAVQAAHPLVGEYENHRYDNGGKNDWHYVTITQVGKSQFKWTNRANVSWTLSLTANKSILTVGSDSPYFNKGYKTANVKWDAQGRVIEIVGPGNEPYKREADHPLVGEYENHLYDKGGKNDYHYVSISRINATQFKWTNRANVSWTLSVTPNKNIFNVGSGSPYFNKGHKTATVKFDAQGKVTEISGPSNEPYTRNAPVVAAPPPTTVSAPAPAPAPQPIATKAAHPLVGEYENHLYDNKGKNNWHYATISQVAHNQFKWTNRANVSWTLQLTSNKNVLSVGSDSPYFSKGHKTANVKWDAQGRVIEISGPGNEPYTRSGLAATAAPAPTPVQIAAPTPIQVAAPTPITTTVTLAPTPITTVTKIEPAPTPVTTVTTLAPAPTTTVTAAPAPTPIPTQTITRVTVPVQEKAMAKVGISTTGAKWTSNHEASGIVGGNVGGRSLLVCRAKKDGIFHMGKRLNNGWFKCSIPVNGATVGINPGEYELLVKDLNEKERWVAAKNGELPTGAFLGTEDARGQVFICKAYYAGFDVLGEILPGGQCKFPHNGKEIGESNYHILVIGEAAAAPPRVDLTPVLPTIEVITSAEYSFESIEEVTLTDTAVDVSVGADGTVVVVGGGGGAPVVYGLEGDKKWTPLHKHSAVNKPQDSRVAVDPQGNAWIVIGNRLFYQNLSGWKEQQMPAPANDVAAGPDGSIWVTTTDNKLYYVRAGTSGARPNGAKVMRIAVDPEGSPFLTTKGAAGDGWGLAKVDKSAGELIKYGRPTYVMAGGVTGPVSVMDIAVAKNGDRWMIGSDNAIYRMVSYLKWAKVKQFNESLYNISADSFGNVWIVAQGGQLLHAKVKGSVATQAVATAPPHIGEWAKSPQNGVTGQNVQLVSYGNGYLAQIDAYEWGLFNSSESISDQPLARYDEVARTKDFVQLDQKTGVKTSVTTGSGLDAGKIVGDEGRSLVIDFKKRKIGLRENQVDAFVYENRYTDFRIVSSVSGYILSKVVTGRDGKRTGAIALDGRYGSRVWWQTYEDGRVKRKLTEKGRTKWSVQLVDEADQRVFINLDTGGVKFGRSSGEDDILSSSSVTGFNLGLVIAGKSLNNTGDANGEIAYVKVGLNSWQEIVKGAPTMSGGNFSRERYESLHTLPPVIPMSYTQTRVTESLITLTSATGGGYMEIDLEKMEIRNAHAQNMATGTFAIKSVAAASDVLMNPNATVPQPNIARSLGPGFQIYNATEWPLTVSIDQVGPLYYGLLNPGEVFDRTTGAVWFTLKAQPSPDGVCHITDWDVAMPIVEITGSIMLAAVTGGASAFATAGGMAAGAAAMKVGAAMAIESALRAAVVQGIKVGIDQVGEAAGADPELMNAITAGTDVLLSSASRGYKLAMAGQFAKQGAKQLSKATAVSIAKKLAVIAYEEANPPSEEEFQRMIAAELKVLTDKGEMVSEEDFLAAMSEEAQKYAPPPEQKLFFFVGDSEFPMSTPRGAAEAAAMFRNTTMSLQGQYAGYPWPFRENKPVYIVTGGPRRLIIPSGDKTLVRFYSEPFKMTLLMD